MNFIKNNFEKILIGIGILIVAIFTIIGNFIYLNGTFSPNILSYYGGFVSGTVGVLFSLAGYLIINKSFRLQKKQSFESLFFNTYKGFNDFRTNQIGLLYLPKELTNTTKPRELHSGYKFFETIFSSSLGFTEFNDGTHKTNKKEIRTVFVKNRSQMSHYFSHLNMLIYAVEKSDSSKVDKNFYMKYLSDQLSDQEKFLINFYKLHPDYKNFNLLDLLEIKGREEFEKLVISEVTAI